uniref:Aminopeptidase n=1 Tax=Aceria tosichella TaxID=561515 RepID=A0A6G1S9Q8_9ACAR
MFAKSTNWLVLLFGIIVACSYGSYGTVGAIEFVDNKVLIHHHRLPRNVIPIKYEIVLDTTENPSSGYSGNVTIDVKFFGPPRENGALKLFNKLVAQCLGGPEECPSVPAGEPNEILMHADKLVRIKTVEVVDKTSGEQMEIVYTGRDTDQQMIMVRLANDLPTDGRLGQIKVHFTAPIRDKKGGVYLSKMRVNGETFTHLLAKFQPVFARLAMPCFDEPHLKATFRLKLRHSRQLTAYANTERERVKWIVSGDGSSTLPSKNVESVFKETPMMSIHMVAFVVGKFDPEPLVEQVRPNLRLRFLSPPGLASRGRFALEVAKKTILQFEEELDGEHLFPLEKLDLVTTGELDTDNLETWGLVFIRNYLVEMGADSQPFTQVNKALNVAHVVIHQWFANLITARWWNDIWITESIAAEQAYYMVEELYPEFDIDYFARLGLLKNTLDMDRPGLMHPLSPPAKDLSTPVKINELFDELTFMKSASLGRMVRSMGSDEYNNGLKCLIARHAFKNINACNLVECFQPAVHGPAPPTEAAGSPSPPPSECTGASRSNCICTRHLSHVYLTARSFGQQSGYPIVNVDLDEGNRRLIVYLESSSLARRELDFGQINEANFKTTARANAWYVPLWVLVKEKGKRDDVWLRLDYDDVNVASVELPDWFDAKEGGYVKVAPAADISTYYRVRYSDRLLDLLKTPIQERELDPMHRLHILEDARGLLRANLITKDAFIKIMDWYKEEDNLAVIFLNYIALVELYRIQSDDYSLMTVPQVSSAVFQKMFAKHKFKFSGDETPIEQFIRKVALCIMIIDGNEDVIDEAVKTYEAVDGDVDELPVFLRVPVYMGVAVDGTRRPVKVKELLERLEETSSLEEQMRLIEGLSRSNHGDVLKKVSEFLFKRSSIGPADLASHFKTLTI